MNKAILRSLSPKQCVRIANGEQTIVLSKTKPKLQTPYKEYIYMTKSKERLIEVIHKGDDIYGTIYNESTPLFVKTFDDSSLIGSSLYSKQGKVIGEYIVETVDTYKYSTIDGLDICDDEMLAARVEWEEVNLLAKGKTLYGLHISQLKIYDNPKELGEFTHCCQKGFNDMYNYLCYREHSNGKLTQCKYNDMGKGECKAQVTLPPQSWMYVEEIE